MITSDSEHVHRRGMHHVRRQEDRSELFTQAALTKIELQLLFFESWIVWREKVGVALRLENCTSQSNGDRRQLPWNARYAWWVSFRRRPDLCRTLSSHQFVKETVAEQWGCNCKRNWVTLFPPMVTTSELQGVAGEASVKFTRPFSLAFGVVDRRVSGVVSLQQGIRAIRDRH